MINKQKGIHPETRLFRRRKKKRLSQLKWCGREHLAKVAQIRWNWSCRHRFRFKWPEVNTWGDLLHQKISCEPNRCYMCLGAWCKTPKPNYPKPRVNASTHTHTLGRINKYYTSHTSCRITLTFWYNGIKYNLLRIVIVIVRNRFFCYVSPGKFVDTSWMFSRW